MRSPSAACDIHHLAVFCAVYEHGCISAGAKKLQLTQPTVSSHLHAMEDELGGPLFDRSSRGVTPTAAGDLLYRHARALVSASVDLERSVKGYFEGLEGRIRLAASTIPGGYLLPRAINEFRQLHQEIEIRLEIGNTKRVLELLSDGSADLGVVGARLNRPEFSFSKLKDDELVVIASPSSSWGVSGEVTLDRLRSTRFLVREVGSGSRASLEQLLRRRGLAPSEFLAAGSFGSTTAVKEAVKAGTGLAVLSRSAVDDELAAGSLAVLQVPGLTPMTRTLYLVKSTDLEVSPPCRTFLLFLRNMFLPKA